MLLPSATLAPSSTLVPSDDAVVEGPGVLTQLTDQDILDHRFPTTGASSYIGYSEDGSTESSLIARTGVGSTGWAAATAAVPSVKANGVTLISAASSGAGTVTAFAVFDAASAGNRLTNWTFLDEELPVVAGSAIAWDVGAARITIS